MIKIYGMKTCPDCISVDKQVEGNARYEVIDIGEHVKNLRNSFDCVIIMPSSMMQRSTVMLVFHALCWKMAP